MNNILALLKQVGVEFENDGDSTIFEYALDGDSAWFRLHEQACSGHLFTSLNAEIYIEPSNREEVMKYINEVNAGMALGALHLDDSNRVLYRAICTWFETTLVDESKLKIWLADCLNLYLGYAKITRFIRPDALSGLEARDEIFRIAGIANH